MHDFARKIIDYIQINLTSHITAQHIAQHFEVNIPTINRYLKNSVGHTVSSLLRTERIKKAIKLIQTTHMRSDEIANKCGYRNYPTFFRAFKDETKM